MTEPAKKHRVLVVDDNQDSATSMSDLLSAAGFDVRTCFDGRSALVTAGEFHPDACVLDINMPGMDGYELARQIRQRFPDHPPVLATMTAYGDDTHLERAADAGFDLQFTKPADPREVAWELDKCVRNGTTFNEAQAHIDPPHVEADARSGVRQLLSRLAGLWTKAKPHTP